MTQVESGKVTVNAALVGQEFGILFIVLGFLSYAISLTSVLGVLSGVEPGTPAPVLAALFKGHNLEHDVLFMVSAATGLVGSVALGKVYGRVGYVIGAIFVILSILVLLIEPALPLRVLLGSAYGPIHTPWHIAMGVLQVITGAAAFGLLRKPRA